jgi:hypothetical protein
MDEQNKKIEEFYKNLEEKLANTNEWPTLYMFKFIIPNDLHKLALVEKLFDKETASMYTNESKTGKYISITAKEMMLTPKDVIKKYKNAAKIDGIIML